MRFSQTKPSSVGSTTNRGRLIAVGERIDEEIRQMFRTEVDLIPDQENKSRTVRLHPITTQGSRRIGRQICAEVTATETVFIGTDPHLIYEISGSR